jgi:hypothetical protein
LENLDLSTDDRTPSPLMNVIEDYAKQWAKRENEELYTLSEWLKV